MIAALGQKARFDHGIETYVIGLKGAKFSQLDELAKAGGTEKAFDITKDVQAFSDKMLQIREQALGCEYVIPEQKQSEADFDPKKVNVHYASGDSEQVELAQAKDEADCADSEGWYYDDPATPSKIILCPVSCTAVDSDHAAKVSLTFGCPTKLN
jgi:hypothetical protein